MENIDHLILHRLVVVEVRVAPKLNWVCPGQPKLVLSGFILPQGRGSL